MMKDWTVAAWTVFLAVALMVNSAATASQKKGLAVSPTDILCGDLTVLKGAHWWYNWGPNTDPYTKLHCAEPVLPGFVPMVWGWGAHGPYYPLQRVVNTSSLLGFNEPNHGGQSHLNFTHAAEAWKVLEKHFPASQKLVSPSSSPCGGPSCLGDTMQWFDGFFKECTGCRVDYLASHYYGCNAGYLMSFLEHLWHRYHRRIWLTEFACANGDAHKELAYMKQVLPLLEAAPYVYRYSWFVTRSTHGRTGWNLLRANDSQLTELGRFYMDYTPQDSVIGR